jgi:hypothetical protein
MPALKHKVGTRFGRLVIQERLGLRANCLCDCGKVVSVLISNLGNGHIRSCGCLRTEVTIERSFKHGSSRRGQKTRAYEVWCGITKRCSNQNGADWKNYGERGITICKEWAESFDQFLKDMGDPPPGYSIERIDVNGNYCKDNCTWATRKEQNNNTRRNTFITFNGRTQTLAQWSDELGISRSKIMSRRKKGLPVEQVLEVGK